ncbi:MAG: hypothetical protein FWG71_04930 [Synergistaceae bacterium]|nr:hypothetical protein [Synergistaceae bacterium]
MTTLTAEREKLSKIITNLPDAHVPVVLDMLENWNEEEDLTPDEEEALLAYQASKQDGSLETISLEDVREKFSIHVPTS